MILLSLFLHFFPIRKFSGMTRTTTKFDVNAVLCWCFSFYIDVVISGFCYFGIKYIRTTCIRVSLALNLATNNTKYVKAIHFIFWLQHKLQLLLFCSKCCAPNRIKTYFTFPNYTENELDFYILDSEMSDFKWTIWLCVIILQWVSIGTINSASSTEETCIIYFPKYE